MLRKTNINLSFKDSPNYHDNKLLDRDQLTQKEVELSRKATMKACDEKEKEKENIPSDKKSNKNCWSGYHVQFRNPRDFQQFAIDEKFNRWGDMVEYFKSQDRPYRLSQGSLKDLLYGTYKRKGMHSLSLNDLVSIHKIDREKITKTKSPENDNDIDIDIDTHEGAFTPLPLPKPQLVLGH